MIVLIVATFSSFLLTLLLIYVSSQFHIGNTSHNQHIQAIHLDNVPRLGGLPIFVAFFFGALAIYFFRNSNQSLSLWLLIASIPALLIGLAEDTTAKVRAKYRLIIIASSAALLVYFFQINSLYFDIVFLDKILNQSFHYHPLLVWLFIVFSVTGLTNAFNIIDGLNGLSSSVAIFSACAIAYVALKVNDFEIFYCALLLIGTVTGFLFWNYPRGMVFLGDGGAYFIGFMISSLSILITVRHQQISPWFALLINIYPVFETIFSIWRRRIHQGRSSMNADLAHLHSLLYRRLIRSIGKNKSATSADVIKISSIRSVNSLTTSYLWALVSFSVVPSILFWNNTMALVTACIIFISLYLYFYHLLTYSKKLFR